MKKLGTIGHRGAPALWIKLTFTITLGVSSFGSRAALPDLIIHGPAVQPQIVFRTFASSDCEVVEGCAIAGTRRLLSFASEIRNIASVDLNLGPPGSNPLFHWADCHGHYHFEDFALYRLLNASGSVVVTGRKIAFCLEDTYRWRAASGATRRYSCGTTQGIQAGWADVYDPAVPCQWLDITGVPGGNYTLELILDPSNRIAEANEGNNTVRVAVTLPGDCPAPANDLFANAQLIAGVAASATGDNVCATRQGGEPNHAGDSGGHSLWYQWVAPYGGSVLVNTVGSDFDTLLAVYTGSSVSSLTLIAQNDDIVPLTNRQSQLTFNAVSNTTYLIAVDGWAGEVGGVKLNVNPPGNDAFTNCLSLSGAAGQVTGHNIGASKQPGEPAHAGNIGGHSVWYCWTAPASGDWIFDLTTSDFDTLLAVYTGSAVGSLTNVVSDDDSGGNGRSRLTLNAIAGRNYRIAADGSSGATGTIRLRWSASVRLSLRRLITGVMELTIGGAPGTYLVQTSSNLISWSTLATLTTTNSPHRHNDQGNSKSRFYRAVRQP